MQCARCEKLIIPHPVPYGMAWLCVCGHWMVMFSVDKGMVFFETGNEETALKYIDKIVGVLGVDENV